MKFFLSIIAATFFVGVVCSDSWFSKLPEECRRTYKRVDLLDFKLHEIIRDLCINSTLKYTYVIDLNLCVQDEPEDQNDCELTVVANERPQPPRFETLEQCIQRCVAPNRHINLAPLQKLIP